jgi:hypothetical protein
MKTISEIKSALCNMAADILLAQLRGNNNAQLQILLDIVKTAIKESDDLSD